MLWRRAFPTPYAEVAMATDFAALLAQYRQTLLHDVMPFWQRHAVDPAGGLNTCLRDDGTLVSRDKWLWSQWRAVWVYSTLYTAIEPRREWLDLALHIYRFARRHGWDERVGGWVLRLDGDGRVLDGCDSIYVDAFAIYGLTALARATGGDAEVVALARQTADHALRRLRELPGDQVPHFPYPIPAGARPHGIPMMFSLVFWELGQYLDDEPYRLAALAWQHQIFSQFYQPRRDLIVERIALDGREFPPPEGSAVVPGHVVEDMWFQIHLARDRGDTPLIREALRLMRRHLELGWDEEFGGLLLAVDAEGRPEIGWRFAETKLWWPHTEALYALLLAHELCGEPWCLAWYERIHQYSFTHYPVPGHGEWRQKLDRRAQPITDTVALPVKDPFHLPRALIYAILTLERLTGQPLR
jgi:N-acylglucosamine 2-epimerase